MLKHFEGKNILITGAASGIGKDLALVLGTLNCRLALIDINPILLPQVPLNSLSFKGDVTNAEQMQQLAQSLLQAWGRIDIVIAAAGVGGMNPAQCFNTELDCKTMAINYFGTVNTFSPFIGPMTQQKSGQLVGICSLAALRGLPGGGSYSASKAAQLSLLESFRVDLGPLGINVLSVLPGFVQTPMTNHDEFKMPFLVPVRKSSHLILRAISRSRRYYAYPWQMSWLSKLNRLLPPCLYDFLMPKLGAAKTNEAKLFSGS